MSTVEIKPLVKRILEVEEEYNSNIIAILKSYVDSGASIQDIAEDFEWPKTAVQRLLSYTKLSTKYSKGETRVPRPHGKSVEGLRRIGEAAKARAKTYKLDGFVGTIPQHAARLGVSRQTLEYRIKRTNQRIADTSTPICLRHGTFTKVTEVNKADYPASVLLQ